MTRTECRRVLSTMLVLAALAPAVAGAETAVADQAPAEQATALPEPEQTFVSSKDIVVYPPGRGSPAFRFLPDSRYIPYERSIVLSAAPGETRAYLMQVTSGKVSGDGPATTGYVIDKKRPPAPRAEPGTGLFREAIKPVLSGEEGESTVPLSPPSSHPRPSRKYRSVLAHPSIRRAMFMASWISTLVQRVM